MVNSRLGQVAPVETSYRLAKTRVKMNAHRINKFEFPFYEEMINVRTKRYQLLLEMYAEVQRSNSILHDSEYCMWKRMLKPDEPCNCTTVQVGRLHFDGCELPPVMPQAYYRYSLEGWVYGWVDELKAGLWRRSFGLVI